MRSDSLGGRTPHSHVASIGRQVNKVERGDWHSHSGPTFPLRENTRFFILLAPAFPSLR